MPSIAVFGAQWGDEGKGRFVDYLAQKADMVVRYQGGNNAGHTIEAGGRQFRLHLVPSGVLFPDKDCVIGNGVAVNPKALIEEIEGLRAQGFPADRIYLSDRAHVVMPYHIELDKLSEAARGSDSIGTTMRGIGPCYTDMTERTGIRVCDIVEPETFKKKLMINVGIKSRIAKAMYNAAPFDVEAIYDEYTEYATKLRRYVTDTSIMVYEAYRQGKKILFEGAQGMLLDVALGTYPYVTSSHPSPGGISIGVGIGPCMIDSVLGVVKAYTTRVGKGPFPTELDDETGALIREKGNEYGTTTGRPRRCGWLDMVIVRFAVRAGSAGALAVTRMDTLGGLKNVKMCVGYEIGAKRIDEFPASLKVLSNCTPVYEDFEGWDADISHVRRFDELPRAAQRYIEAIEKYSGVPVALIGVGASREQCIVRKEVF